MTDRRSFRVLGSLAAALLAFLAAQPASATLFAAAMDGAQEVGPTASNATGFTAVEVVGDALSVTVNWSFLDGGNPVAAHIHCCIPVGTNVNVAIGFPNFPATTSGMYTNVFDLLDPTTYSASFLANFGGGTAAGARDVLIAGLEAGEAYSNIHNSVFPGGEIRGNLAPIPEASTSLLVLTGLAALARRRPS